MSEYLGESEEMLAQPGFARQAVIAKPASRSKSKRIVAIFLGATLALGIFFALRSQKHKIDSTAAGAEDHSVIVHVSTAYQGDMGVYIDALGTVTPISTVNIYSQVSGQVLAVHYREGQIVHKGGVIGAQNANRPKGQISDETTIADITANDQISKARDYAPLIVGSKDNSVIRLSDVATITDSVENLRSAAYVNGKESVSLLVYCSPGANVISTVDEIKRELPSIRASITRADHFSACIQSA